MKLNSSSSHTHHFRFILMASLSLLLPAGIGNCADKIWHRIGLNTPTSIYALAVDPTESETVYAGTHNGGVFKSIDGGKHWDQTSLSNGFISVLLIDPKNSQTVYAGGYGGAYKSSNAGKDWNSLMSGQVTSIVLAADSSERQIIYVGTRDKGIFKNTDQSHLWKQVGLSERPVESLAVDPRTPDTVYAGTYNGGLYKTVDGGSSWTHIGFADYWVQTLLVDPEDPRIVYAGTINGDDGVFKSTDEGLNWQRVTQGSVWALAIGPASNPLFFQSAIYMGGSTGVFKSTDKGDTWKATDLNYYFLWVNCLAIDPLHPATVYTGTTAEGVFKTNNGGSTWDTVNSGLNDTPIESLAIDPSEPRTIYAGAGGGIFKTTDKGRNWVQLGLGTTGVEVMVIDPAAPKTIYAGTMSGVYKSIDGGASWIAANTGFGSYPAWVTALILDPVDSRTLYAGTTIGLFKTVDGGQNWRKSNLEKINIRAVAIDPSTPTTVYAGSYAGGMFKSTNAGADWHSINGSLTDPQIISIAIDSNNSKTIYIGTDNLGPYKSTNGGTDWKPVGDRWPGVKLAIDPTDSHVLYGYDSTRSLYRSIDGGESWNSLSLNLPSNSGLCLAIDPTGRQTPYIGTYGVGIWAYSLDLDLSLENGGTAKASTGIEDGLPLSGIAEVSIHSGSTPYGAAVIRLKQNGVTVSETVVPSTPPTTRTRIFVDNRLNVPSLPGRTDSGTIDTNTGIAIVNYGARVANLTYTLRDMNGMILAIGHGIVQGRGFAKFLDQLKEVAPDFILTPDFPTAIQFGSLEIDSDRPVSILALRMTTNQRHEAVMTTTATADSTAYSSKRYIPQIADGGGYQTSISLLNVTDSFQKGTLRFFNESGAPLIVRQAGGAVASSFDYFIPANGAFRFQTDGLPANVQVGWVELDPGYYSVPDGTGTISFNQGNILVTETGIALVDATNHARVHIDLSGRHNTGLAVANPLDTDLNLVVNAFQSDGVTGVGTPNGVLSLAAKGHQSRFADELIKGLPAGFVGVLDISSSQEFAVLATRSLFNERNEMLMSSMPIADYNRPAPSPIVFPRVVGGGDYVTDFILFSSGSEADATLSFYGDEGISINSGNEQ